jgi:hypothetical protein
LNRLLPVAGGIGAGVLIGALWPDSKPAAPPESNLSEANLSEAPAFATLNNGPADATPLPFPDAAEPATGGGDLHFRYCSEARAAGVAPLYRGDPGYAPHLDRDGDGVACEPYPGR